ESYKPPHQRDRLDGGVIDLPAVLGGDDGAFLLRRLRLVLEHGEEAGLLAHLLRRRLAEDEVGGPATVTRRRGYLGGGTTKQPRPCGSVKTRVALVVLIRLVVDPAPIDIQRPRPVREDVGRDRSCKGLTGHDDRLMRGFQSGAPAVPLLGFVSGGSGDVVLTRRGFDTAQAAHICRFPANPGSRNLTLRLDTLNQRAVLFRQP